MNEKINRNEIIKMIKKNRCLKIEGVFANTLTAIINKIDSIGGYSVFVVENEIRIFQHPGAGDFEEIIEFGEEI